MQAALAPNLPGSVRGDAADVVAPTVFVIGGDAEERESLERRVRTEGWEAEGFASVDEWLLRRGDAVPCCVILNLAVPGLSGLELQAQLAERPEVPLIVVTRPLTHAVLVSVIRAAIERSRAALARDAEIQLLRNCYALLSRRERQVMALVVSGLLNKQIGGKLGISEITVKAHRGQVMRKMEAASLAHLVTIAAQLGVRDATPREATV